jgi:hypothetical protein
VGRLQGRNVLAQTEAGHENEKPLTAAGARRMLHRARERFADLLLEHVVDALDQPGPDELTNELTEPQLLQYRAPALVRRREKE